MKTSHQETKPQEPRAGQTRRRGLLLLVLSLALVAAACNSNDDSSDTTAVAAATATTTTAPTTTAAPTTTVAPTTTMAPESANGVSPQIVTVEAMYDALNAHDADAYAVYWAEDAVGWGPWVWGNEQVPVDSPEMDKGFEERRAWGAHFALSDCEQVDKEDRYEEVRCLETWDDRVWYGMAGLTIDREAVYTFDEQGMITTMIHVNHYTDELEDWQAVFGPWMQATYPEIAETYLVPGFDKAFKREVVWASPESIAEFTGLIEEFVAQSDTYPLAPVPGSSISEAEQATQFLDQFVTEWSARNEEAVFEMVLPNGVFVTTDGTELAGEELVDSWTRYMDDISIERTGDAVDNGDGSYSFNVDLDRTKMVLTITLNGDELVSMVETRQ